MASRIERVARGIDDVTEAVWDESSLPVKIAVLFVLIVTATAIPLVPIAIVARWLAR